MSTLFTGSPRLPTVIGIPPATHILLAAFAVSLLWLAKTIFMAAVRIRSMPPGPRGLPILGNLLDLPLGHPWFKLAEWKQQYGSLYTLNMAGKPILVVGGHKVAEDLFERRSNIYSDRPNFTMASQIMTQGLFVALGRWHDPVWRKMRRAASENFTPRASEQYQPMQTLQAGLTILDILANPDAWEDALYRAMASNILTAVYGWPRIGPEDKAVVRRISAHVERISEAAIPGRYLVDAFPAMKHLPPSIAKWKREGLAWHERESGMFAGFTRGVSERLEKGESPTCFVAHLLTTMEKHGLKPKECDWLAGVMFAGGVDTSAAALCSFVLAMITYPDKMRKAQAELDEVVGRDRLPTFKDKDKLPYVRAVINEVLRWRPSSPLAVPRSTTEDDTYNGYFIPKGSFIITNVYAMYHDPDVFPEPNVFRPERWLGPDGCPPNLSFGFGFGKRVCIGQHFAAQAMFINIATFLWALDIRKAVDAAGRPITPNPDKIAENNGLVLGPEPFPCVMTPRFPEAQAIIEREAALRASE